MNESTTITEMTPAWRYDFWANNMSAEDFHDFHMTGYCLVHRAHFETGAPWEAHNSPTDVVRVARYDFTCQHCGHRGITLLIPRENYDWARSHDLETVDDFGIQPFKYGDELPQGFTPMPFRLTTKTVQQEVAYGKELRDRAKRKFAPVESPNPMRRPNTSEVVALPQIKSSGGQ